MVTTTLKRAEVVAQDEHTAHRLRGFLEDLHYVVETKSTVAPEADADTFSAADVIIYDVSTEAAQAERRRRRRPGSSSSAAGAGFWMEVLHRLYESAPMVPILVTLPPGVEAADAALESGATDVIQGAVTPGIIRRRLEMLEAFVRASTAEPRAVPAGLRATGGAVDVPLPALRSAASGRLDAQKIADYMGIPLRRFAIALGLPYASVHKTPDAPRGQEPLTPVARVLELAAAVLGSREAVRMWLNRRLRELENESPLQVILAGEAGAVETLLYNARSGIPG